MPGVGKPLNFARVARDTGRGAIKFQGANGLTEKVFTRDLTRLRRLIPERSLLLQGEGVNIVA
jgi:hypothetical protein